MIPIVVIWVVIFVIAVVMAMTGRGGGNFYVPVLIAVGLAMHEAATVAQFILFCTAVAALLVFQKSRTVDWKLALVIDPPTDVMAFVGGYYAHVFSGGVLKLIFAFLLVIAGFFMLYPVKERVQDKRKRFGFWHRRFGDNSYVVNLWVAIPITALTGLVAGMVGISGGSFKIPLMVLACGVPMRIAIGTSSAMVAVTALMGFLGHTAGGDFNPYWAIPLMIVAVFGGLIGGKLSLKAKPDNLKRIFAYTTLVAAIFMLVNAFLSG
ncbi:MAG: sulfite exporter TauE/SafE family protein [Candidatus Makaraimicrobium thalassicum]|nr:MAG: sulfite exporter TauE/SafE family protein [Candidatus Omnitrophota bacterium]